MYHTYISQGIFDKCINPKIHIFFSIFENAKEKKKL